MWLVLVIIAVGLPAGALLGRQLAARGITAENALKGHQLGAYLVLGAATLSVALLYFAPRILWLPETVVLLAEAAVWPVVQALAVSTLGLLVGLEWPGRRDRRRLARMIGSAAVLALAEGFLAWRSLPIVELLQPSWIVDGVVMQTSSYTCAPATIATLARALGDTVATERRMVELAGTSRQGTTTLAEIRALSALGMSPRFARGLAPESLAAAGGLALLHVDEWVVTATVRHAVALLEVDARNRTVTLGNPLYGRQVKPWSALRGYWTGEAVFVSPAP